MNWWLLIALAALYWWIRKISRTAPFASHIRRDRAPDGSVIIDAEYEVIDEAKPQSGTAADQRPSSPSGNQPGF